MHRCNFANRDDVVDDVPYGFGMRSVAMRNQLQTVHVATATLPCVTDKPAGDQRLARGSADSKVIRLSPIEIQIDCNGPTGSHVDDESIAGVAELDLIQCFHRRFGRGFRLSFVCRGSV